MRPERPNLRPERPGLRPEKPYLMPKRPGLRPNRLDLRPERPDSRSQRPDLGLEGPNGGTHKQTHERTNESPPVFYRTLSPSGPLPCYPSHKLTIMQSRATGIADHINCPLATGSPFKTISHFSIVKSYSLIAIDLAPPPVETVR